MADLGISVTESTAIQEYRFGELQRDISTFDWCNIAEYVVMVDINHDRVSVVEAVTIEITRTISVYDSATVVDAGISFNEHLYTDPRPSHYPKAPAREGYGSFGKSINTEEHVTLPARGLEARMGACSSSLSPARDLESSAATLLTLSFTGKLESRSLSARTGGVLDKKLPTRDGVFTAYGDDLSLRLDESAPGRMLSASMGSGGFFSLEKWTPVRTIEGTIGTGGWGELDCIIPCRTIVSSMSYGSSYELVGGDLLIPPRELEATMNSGSMTLTLNRSPMVVTLIEMEKEKPTADYVLSYGG